MIENKIREEECVRVSLEGSEHLKGLIEAGKTPEIIKVNGEEFKLIKGKRAKKDSYYVSKNAEVYSVIGNSILKPAVDRNKRYPHLFLGGEEKTSGGYSKKMFLHHIVAFTYLGERPKYVREDGVEDEMVIHHKDGNILNNNLSNLEYVTHAENASEGNTRRLTKEQAVEIYLRYLEEGKQFKDYEVAEEYNVGVRVVSNIISKASWIKETNAVDMELSEVKELKKDKLKGRLKDSMLSVSKIKPAVYIRNGAML